MNGLLESRSASRRLSEHPFQRKEAVEPICLGQLTYPKPETA